MDMDNKYQAFFYLWNINEKYVCLWSVLSFSFIKGCSNDEPANFERRHLKDDRPGEYTDGSDHVQDGKVDYKDADCSARPNCVNSDSIL